MARYKIRDFGTCLSFDGSTTFVSIPNTGLTFSVFTYAAWINTRDTTTQAIIANNQVSNCPLFKIGSSLLVLDKQNVAQIGASTLKVRVGVWQHAAVTYDASGNYAFYLDGVPCGTGTSLQTFAFTANTLIGYGAVGPDEFNGLIDDVRMYDAVLTPTQISDMYYGIDPSTTNLQGWWKFDEGSGTTANDSSGNSRTGTITAATYSTNVAFKPRTLIT